MAFKRDKSKLDPAKMLPDEKEKLEQDFLSKADKTKAEIENKRIDKTVDGNTEEKTSTRKVFTVDEPNAPRDYLKMTARFNKYEVDVLDKLSREYGLNRMNVMRVAFMALAKEKGLL